MQLFPLVIRSDAIEDAFVYRTSLYCWTFEHRLRVYSIADIERAVHASANEFGAALTYALFHSRGIGATSSQATAWRQCPAAWETLPETTLEAENIPYVEYRMGVEANYLLDFLIFYDRFYFAMDGGLFSLDPFDEESAPAMLRPATRVTEPCYSAAAGLGAVAASCGTNGLKLLFDEVSFGSNGRAPRQSAAESVRAELGSGTVVNHRTRADYEFFAGELSGDANAQVLQHLMPASVERSHVFRESVTEDEGDVEFTLWDLSRLVIFKGGQILSISVKRDDTSRVLNNVRELGVYGDAGRVISATRIGRAFAIETDDTVLIVGDDGIRIPPVGPVVSLRSYPRSHRYRRLITATGRDGLWLLGVDS